MKRALLFLLPLLPLAHGEGRHDYARGIAATACPYRDWLDVHEWFEGRRQAHAEWEAIEGNGP